MTEVPDLQPFAAAVREAIAADVFKYDQGLAAWREQANELIRAGDYVFHATSPEVVVPAVARISMEMTQGVTQDLALLIGLVVDAVIELEHENKRLRTVATALLLDQEE